MLIEQMLDQYFKGQLSPEEKERLFKAISMDPSLEDTIQTLLKGVDPEKARQFLSEKSLMCDTHLLSESDEAQIEMYLSGLMSEDEEEIFKQHLMSDEDFQTNAFAHAFLYKAIKRIQDEDAKTLESARTVSEADFAEMFGIVRDEADDGEIERYMTDTMSMDEKTAFEARMSSDGKFRERVTSAAVLEKGIMNEQQASALALDDAAKLTKEDVITVINRERVSASTYAAASTRIPVWTMVRKVAAVALVLVVFGGVYDYSNSSIMRSMAGQNMQFAMSGVSAPTKGSSSEAEESVRSELKELFDIVEKNESISESTVSRLREFYDVATDGNADYEDTYVDQISLAMATAYIYTGQKGKAKEVLKETVANLDVSEDARDKAEKLLKKTKRSILF